MEQWISKETMIWISIGSGIALLIGAITVPFIVIKLPKNAFSNVNRAGWLDRQPAPVRAVLRILKNVVGFVLIVLGIAMLVLPGQGILAILLGVMLADLPGKQRLQQWIVRRPKVMSTLNWLRCRFGRPPLETPSAKLAA